MKSVFMDKSAKPGDGDLRTALADTFGFWQTLVQFAHEQYPLAVGQWHFSGDTYGWSFRISDSKRVLVYFLPRAGFFKVALVFGQKATDRILESDVSESIKDELKAAKAYAEGRGIRLEVKDASSLNDIRYLIEIKGTH